VSEITFIYREVQAVTSLLFQPSMSVEQ